jgi:hypothetical protein
MKKINIYAHTVSKKIDRELIFGMISISKPLGLEIIISEKPKLIF